LISVFLYFDIMQYILENSFFIIFLILTIGVLLFDLLFLAEKKHVISFRESLIWTSIWILLSFLFFIFIYLYGNKIHNIDNIVTLKSYLSTFYPHLKIDQLNFSEAMLLYRKNIATDFVTGYFLEYSLSIDNIFVILMILIAFSVNPIYYKTVLFWGILGAIFLRFIFIFLGSALITKYNWLLYLFGIFLLYSGIKMFLGRNNKEKLEVKDHFLVKYLSKYFNVYPEFKNQKFWLLSNGKIFITPLLIVLILIEFTDLVFAFDSIPAIFSITRDPYIVFFSNIFAILGLRSLFFLLIKILEYFRFLKIGISLLLIFVGFKLLMNHYLEKIGFTNIYSLLFILIILFLCIILSILLPSKRNVL
jgi:tellurite resistance protein TerC